VRPGFPQRYVESDPNTTETNSGSTAQSRRLRERPNDPFDAKESGSRAPPEGVRVGRNISALRGGGVGAETEEERDYNTRVVIHRSRLRVATLPADP